MSDSPLDAAPVDKLAPAFELPAYIGEHPDFGERLRGIHDEVVERLRREAMGLPMDTVQQLLIERIALIYIQIRYHEYANKWDSVNQQKELNNYWATITTEFSRLLANHEDKLREALFEEISGVVNDAIKGIEDEETRKALRLKVKEGLAAINL